MGVFSRKKRTARSFNLPTLCQGQQQIRIISRSDGLTTSGLPSHANQQITTYPNTLMCSDGTKLPIKTSNTLLSGISANRDEIIRLQIANAIRNGFTPVVISSQGKGGEVYQILRTFYYEKDVKYISNNSLSDYYLPFLGMDPSKITAFFYQISNTLDNQAVSKSMLYKKYIDVCVKIFCGNGEAVQRLIGGQIDHFGLLSEITNLRNSGRLTQQEESTLRSMADSAQSVSVSVLSIFYDFMYKMRRSFAPKPLKFPFNAGKINEKKCVFLQLDSAMEVQSNTPFAPCYQWYLSKVIEAEFQADALLPNQRILLMIDNLNGTLLRWFHWMMSLRNCVLMLNYDDYYAVLTDAADLRENLASGMDRIFFFAHINSLSAEWCSRFIGVRPVTKREKTIHAPRTWTDVFFPVSDIHEREIDEAWYRKEDIQRLGNAGVVYCKDGIVFRNGNHFCQFQFERR